MAGFGGNCRVGAVLLFSAWITLAALNRLVRRAPNGCHMTYMYPTYIPISTPKNVSSDRYGLFLYHEGWKQIDFDEHVRKLGGVPVLFIPGNDSSYKQVMACFAWPVAMYGHVNDALLLASLDYPSRSPTTAALLYNHRPPFPNPQIHRFPLHPYSFLSSSVGRAAYSRVWGNRAASCGFGSRRVTRFGGKVQVAQLYHYRTSFPIFTEDDASWTSFDISDCLVRSSLV